MKKILLLLVLALILLLPIESNANPEKKKIKDLWQDESYPFESNSFQEFKKILPKKDKDILKIQYYIDLGRQKNSRIVFSGLNITTYIDTEKDIAFDHIQINFLDRDRTNPDLIGERLYLYQLTHLCANNIKIINVVAPGWSIIKHINHSSVLLENIENKYFGSQIDIVIEISEQSKFKGRDFKIFNRDAITFKSFTKIDNSHEFLWINLNLPHKFKPLTEVKKQEDLWDFYTESSIHSQNITKNIFSFFATLKGTDYTGGNSFSGLKPEKIIDFNYTYDYQEDTNKKIVEESNLATILALVLFGVSILFNIGFFILSKWSKE